MTSEPLQPDWQSNLAKRRCMVCRRRLGDGPHVDAVIGRIGLVVIHQECDGNPFNRDAVHAERERRRACA